MMFVLGRVRVLLIKPWHQNAKQQRHWATQQRQNMERKQRAPGLTSDVQALDWIDHQKCYRENYVLHKEIMLKSINHILNFYWMFKDWELDAKHWKYTIKSFHILVKLVDLAFKSKVLILFQKLPQLSLLQTWKRFLQRQFSECRSEVHDLLLV